MFKRRSAMVAVVLAALSAAFGQSEPTKDTPLPIPPLLENISKVPGAVEYALTATAGPAPFQSSKNVVTFGYNGAFLGPTLRAGIGERVTIHVHNSLPDAITTHWHGMLLPGDMDGGPRQTIMPQAEWIARFEITQPAATLWYHPHPEGDTARLVYQGMAGFFILDDRTSHALQLPHRYGVDDIPLALMDRRLNDGSNAYRPDMADLMEGFRGDTVLVNGAIEPTLDVPAAKVRLRILNASNGRIYSLHLNDGSPFWLIATDGGLVEKPVQLDTLDLSPGERAELMLDFSKTPPQDKVTLQSTRFKLLTFRVNSAQLDPTPLPDHLVKIDWLAESEAQRQRSFSLQTMHMTMAINGRQMDMNRIDATAHLHDTEVWTITSQTMGMMGGRMGMGGMMYILHSFHVHGVQFQILDRDGQPPPASERGWKDTLLIHPGERVRIILRFDHPGIFMYHCHVLEHEDAGMMGQFEVR